MHPYQIDEDVRTRKILIAVFFSAIITYLLNVVVQYLSLTIPWWIDAPSVMGFYGFFNWLFDNYLWKSRFVQQLDWLQIPNLNGIWDTELKTSHDKFTETYRCHTTIRQTASKISISIVSGTSLSHSVHAAILHTGKFSAFEIVYNYINEPKADSLSTMNIHYGTAWHLISNDGKTLEGEYYSGRGRQTFGSIILKRS